jgi:6-phosphogluconate dehydrogenase
LDPPSELWQRLPSQVDALVDQRKANAALSALSAYKEFTNKKATLQRPRNSLIFLVAGDRYGISDDFISTVIPRGIRGRRPKVA